jgi:hypothetical protein
LLDDGNGPVAAVAEFTDPALDEMGRDASQDE